MCKAARFVWMILVVLVIVSGQKKRQILLRRLHTIALSSYGFNSTSQKTKQTITDVLDI